MRLSSLLLLVSLAANVALAAFVYARRAAGSPFSTNDTADVRTAASESPAGSDTARNAGPGDASANVADTDYVARLRASGMPPDLIRALVHQRIHSRYRDRIRSLQPKDTDPYWLSWNTTGMQAASPEIRAKMRAIYKEIEAEIRAVLGDGSESLAGYDRTQRDRLTGYLSHAKIQQIEAIRKDYDELAAGVRSRGRGLVLKADREELRLLERERRADLVAALTPEELLEYDLRASPTSNNVRNRLNFFEPTEEEFRAIAKIQLAIDHQFGLSHLSGEEQDRRKTAEQQFPSQVQAVLTPERFAEFKATIDGSFSETLRFTSAYNLDRSVAIDLMTLKQQLWQQADALDQAGLPAEQHAASLKVLADEANRQLLTKLGPEVLEKYKNSQPRWLYRLTHPAPRS